MAREYPTDLIVRRDSSRSRGTGLDQDSVVQAEVLLTIPKSSVVGRLGRFDEATLPEIDRCLKTSLGLS